MEGKLAGCLLAPGWTHETLLSKHKSKPFNPDIANAFFRAGFVEIWGRGIEKVCEICQSCGIASPTIDLLGEDLTVTLHNSKQVKPDSYPAASSIPNEGELSQLEQIIVNEIKNNPKVTLLGISQFANVSKRNVQYAINKLTSRGIIRREGPTRGGEWVVLRQK